MSHPTPGSTHTNTFTPQASSQALLDELRVAADRARDERLKLARLFKQSADLPVQHNNAPAAPAVPDTRLAALSEQVERLERAVAEKLDALADVQQDIESRTQYLDSLRHTITDTTRAFVTQVEQAQHFKAHVDAAKQHVKMSAGRVVEDIRQHLSEYEAPIADRLQQLNELDEQIDKRIARMQQMHKQAGDAVDKHLLAALRAAKEQAADLAAPVKAELDKHLAAQHEQIEKAIHQKIAELDVDVEDALRPLTSRFQQVVTDAEARAEALAASLTGRIEEQARQQMDTLRAEVAKQAEAIVTGTDPEALAKAEQLMRDKIAGELDSFLSQADEEAGGYVDGLIGKLEDARLQALDRFEQGIKQIETDCTVDRDEALRRLDEEVERLNQQVADRVGHATRAVESMADGIHQQASSAVEAAFKVSAKRLDEHESALADRVQQLDDKVDAGASVNRRRLDEHEQQARRQHEEIARMIDSGIAAAQQRLSGFEAGISQRIGLATQAANDAISSVDDRLNKLEQGAAARVTRIVELAETSGQAVADSLTDLSRSAGQSAERAQQELEDRLGAFEQISAEAMHQAEATLRTNIGELRDASRAMIEVVVKQIRAQADDIEPQTRAVITQAEQTMRRRIGELREGAQSMVDLAVSRLEGQLDEVKRKAQHAAFQGMPPEDGQQPSAHDAA